MDVRYLFLDGYEGDFVNDMRSGKGILKYINGSKIFIIRCLRRRFLK